MLMAKQLLALTPKKVGDRAVHPNIRIIKNEVASGKKYRQVYTRTSLNNPDSTGDSYTLILRNHGTKNNPSDFKFTGDSQIWCHCSCPYFTYYLEVVLKLHGSSEVYNAIKRVPKVTNPKLRPYLCKHLFSTLLYMMNKDRGMKGSDLYLGIHKFKK